MSSVRITFDKFVVSNPNVVGLAAKIFVATPPEKLKQNLGQLFIILETGPNKIHPSPEEVNKSLDFIEGFVSFIEKEYYQEVITEDLEKHFEKILQSANQWIDNNFYTTNLEGNILNIAIIINKESKIFFAIIGEIATRLIQGEEIADLGNTEKKTNEFSHLVGGIINPQDIFFISTSNFFDYFSLEKTQGILIKNPPASASKIFLNLLQEQKEQISLAGLIIKNETDLFSASPEITKLSEPKKVPSPTRIQTKQKKQEKKPKMTDQTQKIMPAKVVVEKKEIALPKELLIEKQDLTILEQPKRTNLSKILIKNFSFLRSFFNNFWRFLRANKLMAKFNQLPLGEKILIVFSLILIVIFIGSLINFSRQAREKEMVQNYNLALTEVQTKINDLKASLIYGNEKKAKELIANIEILLKNLPQKTKKQKNVYNSLSQELNEEINKLYHLSNLIEVKSLIDTAKISPEIKLVSLVSINGDLYGFDNSSNVIYKINFEKKDLERVAELSQTTSPVFKILAPDKDSLFFIKKTGEAALLNVPLKKIFSATIVSPRKNRTLDEALIYADRLYILEKNSNQIYKYNKTSAGYKDESAWIKEKNIDLTKSVSFAADGNIYILNTDGKILKFYKGTLLSFNQEEIWPTMETPTKISTWFEAKNLYILEPKNKRLVIFDKNGKLIKQFYSEKFTDLKDFVVNEKENKIWVLNKTQIVEIDIQ